MQIIHPLLLLFDSPLLLFGNLLGIFFSLFFFLDEDEKLVFITAPNTCTHRMYVHTHTKQSQDSSDAIVESDEGEITVVVVRKNT